MSDREGFMRDYHVRRCDKCCGNCKHFARDYEESACTHPIQARYPLWPEEFEDEEPFFDAYSGTYVDEGNICDLWEKKEEA